MNKKQQQQIGIGIGFGTGGIILIVIFGIAFCPWIQTTFHFNEPETEPEIDLNDYFRLQEYRVITSTGAVGWKAGDVAIIINLDEITEFNNTLKTITFSLQIIMMISSDNVNFDRFTGVRVAKCDATSIYVLATPEAVVTTYRFNLWIPTLEGEELGGSWVALTLDSVLDIKGLPEPTATGAAATVIVPITAHW